MTHVRELLQAGAVRPTAAVDVAALVRDAHRRAWPRWIAWSSGALAVLLSGAAVGEMAPAGPGRPPAVVETPPGPAPYLEDLAGDAQGLQVPALPADGGVPVAAAPRTGEGERRVADTTPPTSSAPARLVPANGPEVTQPNAADAEASVQTSIADDAGCRLSGGEPATCTYVATQRAGFHATGTTWSIEIRRGDQMSRAQAGTDADACEPRGFVQPGDHVTARIGRTPGWEFGMSSSIDVGPWSGAGCRK